MRAASTQESERDSLNLSKLQCDTIAHYNITAHARFICCVFLLQRLTVSASLQFLKSCLSLCLSVSAPVSEASPYEIIRSQELNALLGPKGSPHAVDLLCDLHNTTANMGLCLITYSDHDWIVLHICKHLQARTNQRSSLAWLMYLMVKHIYVSMCVFREKWPPLLSDTFTLIFLSMKPILWIRWGNTDLVRHFIQKSLSIHSPNNANWLLYQHLSSITYRQKWVCRFSYF